MPTAAHSRPKNPVRADTAFVMRFAKSVRIDRERIDRLADEWAAAKMLPPAWMNDVHLESRDPVRLLTYAIVLDSMNFCFWSKERKWSVASRGKTYSGYLALAISLKRWFEEYPDRATFAYFSTMPWKDFREMLHGGEGLLLLRRRWQIVRSVGRVMMKRYGGDPVAFVSSARRKFSLLVPKIARELPSFNDRAEYRGRKVAILKRAQILAGDIWGILGGKGPGVFDDLDYLTAFADYKLPQFLRERDIFIYTPSLEKKIARGTLIAAGSREEVEIRAATVQAVEYLKDALARRGVRRHSFQVDWILWIASKRDALSVPHHLTRTVFY